MRRLIGFALVGILSGFTLPVSSFASETPRPNIIYILADDLGYGDLGCYGQKKIRTPNIDQIAAEGMRFTQHYSGAAVCAPSRFTLMSGKHIGRSSTYGQGQRLKPDTFTLPKMMQQAGYATGAMGKWGLGDDPNHQGLDEWYGFISQSYAHFYYPERIWKNTERIEIPENYQANGLRDDGKYTDKIKDGVYIHDELTKEAVAFIKQNKDKPFFLYLPYTIPHLELVVPPDDPMLAQYKKEFPQFAWDTKEFTRGKAAGGTAFYDGRGYCSTDYARATLAAMISRMDRDIGKIMALLKELELDENTIVMFSSDNGPSWIEIAVDREFFNSNGVLRDGKGSYYEGGLRVPFIARWPKKIKPGTVSDHISYFPDVLPTVAEIAGIEPAEKVDGISMVPELLGKGGQQEHKFLFWANSVRMGKWKYVKGGKNYDGSKAGQLFDLEADIAETTDVLSKHPEVVSKIRRIIDENGIKQTAKPKKKKNK